MMARKMNQRMRRKEEKTRNRGMEERRKKLPNRKEEFALKRLERGNNLDKKEILIIGIEEER